eukprot:TRINITY_DN10540_c0_g1_i1.p1 TRINITY_DN10540_c0_g1~~TRINITY_DN10540_c0_g1_i1.p1  ORF type:complete len:981 (-),score=167.65 TRINITY_DN10540_c0_g1_i1:52-2943(-)
MEKIKFWAYMFIILLPYFASSANPGKIYQQVTDPKTTTAAYNEGTYLQWPKTLDSNDFVTTAITSVHQYGDYLYCTVFNGFIRFDLTAEFTNETEWEDISEFFAINPNYVSDIVNLVYDEKRSQFIAIGTTGGSSVFVRFLDDYETGIKYINSTTNPYYYPIVKNVHSMYYLDEDTFLTVGSNAFAKWTIDEVGEISPDAKILQNVEITSSEYYENELWLGQISGKIEKYALPEDKEEKIETSTLEYSFYLIDAETREVEDTMNGTEPLTIKMDTLIQDISVVKYDYLTKQLYAFTIGSYSSSTDVLSQATVHRIDTTAEELRSEECFILGQFDYSVKSGDIIPEAGLLFGYTFQNPGRIIQISLDDFTYEDTILLNYRGPGGFLHSHIDYENRELLLTGYHYLSLDTMMYKFTLPDSCLNNCFFNGNCTTRQCECQSHIIEFDDEIQWVPYQQPWCQERGCPSNCSSRSIGCDDGNCTCEADWTGDICTVRRCPNDCTNENQGTCDEDTYNCTCNPGYAGVDCSESSILSCEEHFTCSGCITNPSCGWCASSGTCEYGTIIESVESNFCRQWHYDECPNGFVVINYAMLAIIVLLILVNIVSEIIDNSEGDEGVDKREEWYSMQRCNKVWNLVFIFQIAGSLTLLGEDVPTVFFSQMSFWNIFNFAWGFPGVIPTKEATGRKILSLAQYQGWNGIITPSLFANVILTWVIVTAAVIVLGLIITIIVALVRGGSPGFVVKTMPVYLLVRMFDLLLFPGLVFAGIAIRNVSESTVSGSMGALFIVLVIIYLVIIIIAFKLILDKKKLKSLYLPTIKGRFLPLYGHVKVKSVHWAFLPILRKVLLGLLFGLMYSTLIGQIISIIIVFLLTAILIKFSEAYSDYIQEVVEYITAALMIIMHCFLFYFYIPLEQMSGGGITAIVILYSVFLIAVLAVNVIGFIMNWIQKEGVFSFGQCLDCILCRGE